MMYNSLIKSLGKFSDFEGVSCEELKQSRYSSIYIDDFEKLKANVDVFKKLITTKHFSCFYAKEYEVLQFMEEQIREREALTLSLIEDDFENKDRAYIDSREFEKTTLEIPFSYVMWNPHIENKQRISTFYDQERLNPYTTNFYTEIDIENLQRIKEIIYQLAEHSQTYSEVEKTILISNYLQNLVQFIDSNNSSKSISGTYLTETPGIVPTIQMVGSPENVLLSHFGVCAGIANATTLLLSNAEMNVNVRSVHGPGHIWNIVSKNGVTYYCDNTWSITRNKDRYYESLKARSFDDDYLFFGTRKAMMIGHYEPSSYCPKVAEEDLPKQEVTAAVKKLQKEINFSHYNKPIFPSRLAN